MNVFKAVFENKFSCLTSSVSQLVTESYDVFILYERQATSWDAEETLGLFFFYLFNGYQEP